MALVGTPAHTILTYHPYILKKLETGQKELAGEALVYILSLSKEGQVPFLFFSFLPHLNVAYHCKKTMSQ